MTGLRTLCTQWKPGTLFFFSFLYHRFLLHLDNLSVQTLPSTCKQRRVLTEIRTKSCADSTSSPISCVRPSSVTGKKSFVCVCVCVSVRSATGRCSCLTAEQTLACFSTPCPEVCTCRGECAALVQGKVASSLGHLGSVQERQSGLVCSQTLAGFVQVCSPCREPLRTQMGTSMN